MANATAPNPDLQALQDALSQMRLRLLDITGRNRLLNYRHPIGKSLQFIQGQPAAVYERLADGRTQLPIRGLPEPSRGDMILKTGKLLRPDTREWAHANGIASDYELPEGRAEDSPDLRALMYTDDLAKHCRKIEREAHLALEETGANMLHLVLGFLEFPDQRDSDRLFLAPLISIPVSLSKRDTAGRQVFSLQYTGDDIEENLSLREKLHRDHGLALPEFDDESLDVERYFSQISEFSRGHIGFAVRRRTSLCLLSFTNMLLVRDLDPENWPGVLDQNDLLNHRIVRQVFGGTDLHEGDPLAIAEEHNVEEEPADSLPLVFDADSSQHSALVDVLSKGRNLVIVGPPGTGKSQTISNLIAASLSKGKTVLFVAEKLAALEVVRTRLMRANLAPLILELHSTKTSKKLVLESIQARINAQSPGAPNLQNKIRELASFRNELKEYCNLLNAVCANQFGLTVHEIMWRAERHRGALSAPETVFAKSTVADAAELSAPELARRVQALEHLSSQFLEIGQYGPGHPFWGFQPRPLAPGDDIKIASIMEAGRAIAQTLAQHSSRLGSALGCDLRLSASEIARVRHVLSEFLAKCDHALPLDLTPGFVGDDGSLKAARRECESLHLLITKYRTLGGAVALALTNEDGVSEEDLRKLREMDSFGAELGIEWGDCAQIEYVSTSARTAIQKLRSSLANIAAACTRLSIRIEHSAGYLHRLERFASLLNMAPVEEWDNFSSGLSKPGCGAALKALQSVQIQWQQKEAELSASLYLDVLPEEPVLRVAISTLRQGDAWFRLFQPSWRAALAVHRRLRRSKKKVPSNLRLSDLEGILCLTSLEKTWRDDVVWQRYLEGEGAIASLDLERQIKLASWCADISLAMEELKNEVFEVSKLSASQLRSWRREGGDLHVHIGSALAAYESLKVLFPAGESPEGSWESFDSWIEDAVQRILELAQPLKRNSPSGISLRAAITAHDAAIERRRLSALADSHYGARSVIGTEFRGVSTNIDLVLAALAVAETVATLDLPPEIRSRLLAGHPVRIIEGILPEITGVISALTELSESARALSGHGEFNLAMWIGAELSAGLAQFCDRFVSKVNLACDRKSSILEWAGYLSRREEAIDVDLKLFVEHLEQGVIQPAELGEAYQYSAFSTIIRGLFHENPLLGRFSGLKHSKVREAYQRLDREIISMRGNDVSMRSMGAARPPTGKNGIKVDDKTEMYLIEHLLPQQRPRMPVRKVLTRAGRAIQALKPCFMMGPQAVAQYLKPGSVQFDLVIMDEASQLKPEEAIGTIARGAQLVVVGDPKQLPPTSFFTKMNSAAEEEEQFSTTEAQSILDVCLSQFRAPRNLRWHYRSQHHSLIDFSNRYFYRDLVIFPSPYGHSSKLGVRAVYLPDATYEDQTNIREAERVVDAVVEHIATRPEDSLGIVTLNLKQRDLIAEMLEERLKAVEAAEEFKSQWSSAAQPLFVKNLENVQGDERDAIIISTTFGKPTGASVVRQNFGPISKEGGWRRLNVLFTRARKSVALYTSMTPEDIVLDSSTPEGTKALRNYLEYARSGTLVAAEETGREPDSDFERSVISLLQGNGYTVTPQLGVAGYRIDVAVEHPDFKGAYLAAIECDGATYHSAQSVRDRDRIRQEILESLGWRDRIWRIWSTDWFRTPRQEAAKMLSFLAELRGSWRPDYASGSSWVEESRRDLASDSARIRESLIEEEEERTVRVWDTVKYKDVTKPDDVLTIQITESITNLPASLVHRGTPLARTLLGSAVGSEVSMHLPGAASRTFRVLEIISAAATQGA